MDPHVFVKAEIGEPLTFDPALAYDTRSWEVIANVYETLFTYSLSSQELRPRLAAMVPTAENGLIRDEGRTYVLPIRSGIRFRSGDPLTVADVAYSLQRLLVSDPPGGPAWLLAEPMLGVRGLRDDAGHLVVNPSTVFDAVTTEDNAVVLRLHKPFAPFLTLLSIPVTAVLSRPWAIQSGEWPQTADTIEAFTGRQPEQSGLTSQCNGTGPWQLSRWQRDELVELERWDGYWGAPPTLTRVIIVKENDWERRRTMLLTGRADMIQTDRIHVPEVEAREEVRVHDDLRILVCDGIGFNFRIDTQDNPDVGSGQLDGNGIPADFFADIHVRKAFNYAFDWDRLLRETYHGKGEQMLGPIPRGLFGCDEEQPRYRHDREAAVRELRRALGGRLWDSGFYLTIRYNQGNQLRANAADVLKRNVEALNPRFRIDVNPIDFPAYIKGLQRRRLAVFTTGWLVDYPDPHDFVYPILSTGGMYGRARGYHHPALDQLINLGAATIEEERRREIYRRIQQIAYEEAVEIFTVQPVGLAVMRTWVHGWRHDLITGPQAVTDFSTLRKV